MRFFLLLAAVLGLVFSATPARAGSTLRYPAGRSAVIVDVPEGWNAVEDKEDAENHKLTFSPKDTNLGCNIVLMSLGKLDPKQYKSLVVKMGKAAAENAKMAEPAYTGPVEFKSGNGIPLTWEIARGKIDDENFTLMIGLFTAKGATYAIIVGSETSILDDSTKTADQIIDSIEALK